MGQAFEAFDEGLVDDRHRRGELGRDRLGDRALQRALHDPEVPAAGHDVVVVAILGGAHDLVGDLSVRLVQLGRQAGRRDQLLGLDQLGAVDLAVVPRVDPDAARRSSSDPSDWTFRSSRSTSSTAWRPARAKASVAELGTTLPPVWLEEVRWLAGMRAEQVRKHPADAPWLLRAILLRAPDGRLQAIGYLNFHAGP